jgi:putative transposase
MAVGKYVIMPDHVRFSVRGRDNFNLAQWVNGFETRKFSFLRRDEQGRLWQPGFFDHILRNDDSYSEKWEYVRENPVRGGVVQRAEVWP